MRIVLTILLVIIAYPVINKILHIATIFIRCMMVNSEYHHKRNWMLSHGKEREIEYKFIDTYNAQRGWSLIPNLRQKRCGATVVSSNSDGARGTEEFVAGKDTALFFGDSFCFGEDVRDDETIPYFFGKRMGSVQSVNLGGHGYGIDQQYLYLKEVGAKYRPKLICFIISFDNFNRCFLKFRDYAKPRFASKDGSIVLENSPVPEPEHYLKTLKSMPLFPLIPDFFRQALIYYGLNGDRSQRKKICSYILDQIIATAGEFNSNLIFLYVPNFLKMPLRNYVDSFFVSFFKERNVAYLDLADIYTRAQIQGMIDLHTSHFNATANSMIADKLIEATKGLL